jgi:hypothetical protein
MMGQGKAGQKPKFDSSVFDSLRLLAKFIRFSVGTLVIK